MYAARGTELSNNACCIYPTAAFTTATDLAEGYQTLQSQEFDVVMPVTSFSYPIWRSLDREKNVDEVALNFPEHVSSRSQDLPLAFHDAGQWYWFRIQAFLKHGHTFRE